MRAIVLRHSSKRALAHPLRRPPLDRLTLEQRREYEDLIAAFKAGKATYDQLQRKRRELGLAE